MRERMEGREEMMNEEGERKEVSEGGIREEGRKEAREKGKGGREKGRKGERGGE